MAAAVTGQGERRLSQEKARHASSQAFLIA